MHPYRTVPPLRHAWVWALKRDFPHLMFSLNGGVQSSAEVKALLDLEMDGHRLDGIMVVRVCCRALNHGRQRRGVVI